MATSGKYAEKTRRAYGRTVINFIADTLLDLRYVTEADITAYVESFGRQGSQRGLILRALKAYYAYARGIDVPGDPTERLKIPRPRLTRVAKLTPEEETRLLVAAAWWEERRAWAMLLALRTGARVGSLVAVRREDVNLEARSIWFRVAKNDRPYSVPLVGEGLTAARELLRFGHDPIVGVKETQFWSWVAKAGADSGVKAWPHKLRHTFGSRVRKATGDPVVTAALLNHADLSQMPRYAWAENEEKTEAVRRAFGG